MVGLNAFLNERFVMSLTSLNASKKSLRAASVAAIALSGALVLSACSDSGDEKKDSTSSQSASATESSAAESAEQGGESAAIGSEELQFKDAYVTAKGADKMMTAVFGTLHNTTDKDITITEVKGDIDGADYQLHTVDNAGVMKQVSDMKIPAGKDKALEPGGDHIMIMEVKKELSAGDALTLTLVDEDGKEYEMKNIPVRVQQSTHEHYGEGQGDKGHEGHDHMGHDHGDHMSHEGHEGHEHH